MRRVDSLKNLPPIIRWAVVPTVAATALLGCRTNENNEHPTSQSIPSVSTARPSHLKSVEVTLDYSLLEPGGQTCQGGGARPCYAPLHSAPNYMQPTITKIVTGPDGAPKADWPYEPQALEVVCQVRGTQTNDAQGRTSNIWDVIRVPAEHTDPSAIIQLQAGQLDVGAEKDAQGNIISAYVFTPDMWAGNHGVYAELSKCDDTQNPDHYPTVQ